jgi:hypothetical protein
MRKLRSEAQNGWSFAGIICVFVRMISAAATENAGLCVAAVVKTALGHVNNLLWGEQFFLQPLFGSDCTAVMGTSLGCLNENAIKTRYLRKSSSVHGQSGGRLAGLSWIGRQRVFIS